jgi:hypothetical protein
MRTPMRHESAAYLAAIGTVWAAAATRAYDPGAPATRTGPLARPGGRMRVSHSEAGRRR